MWLQAANIDILPDATDRRQPFYCQGSQTSYLERILAMSDASRDESVLVQSEIPEHYDALTLRIALVICDSNEPVGRKNLEITTGASRAKIERRLKWLGADGYINYEKRPLPNPKMPSARFYSWTGKITLKVLQLCFQKLQAKEAVPIRPTENRKETVIAAPISIRAAITQNIRAHAIKSFIQLLLLFVEHGELSMRQAAGLSGDAPQTQHGRFKKLVQFGILQRERKRSSDEKLEFHYFLAPAISQDEILEMAHEYNLIAEPAFDSSNSETEMTSDSSANQLTKKKHQSATEMLVSRLPEFDPSWPQEVKQSWFESYQKLIEMSQKLSN